MKRVGGVTKTHRIGRFLLVKLVVVKRVCRGIYLGKFCKLEQISSLLVSNTNLEVK